MLRVNFRTKEKLIFRIVLVVSAICFFEPRVQAGFPAGNSVTINGEPLFSVRAGFDGLSESHRAQLAQDALDNAIVTDSNPSPDDVKVELIGGSPAVTLNQHRIISVDFGSAKAEGLSPRQLADRWANKIREKLANRPMIFAYKQTLVLNNPIQSTIVTKQQKSIMLSDAFAIPIRVEEKIDTSRLKPGDDVKATVYENYCCRDLFVPQGTEIFGTVREISPGSYEIVFEQLHTPDGAQTKMYGTLSASNIASNAPHPVCTLGIPSGESTEARVPATIAIGGTESQQEQKTALVITPNSDLTLVPSQQLAVIMTEVTPVASLRYNTF